MADLKKVCVPDASVIIKWFIRQGEPDLESAESLKNALIDQKVECVVPSNCFYEVINILSNKVSDEAVWCFSQLLVMDIAQSHLTLGLASRADDIAKKCPGVSFYDAVYHALAMQFGGTFLTADERYYERAKSLKNIMLLKDYK